LAQEQQQQFHDITVS